jgi:putative Mg2+ transporter-C (MgtC) family protein
MSSADIILRLFAAAAIGCSIGLNRFAHHRYIGIRTLGLVALGAAALVVAVLEAGSGGDEIASVSRVIQGIVTGIGFIGAGVIVQREQRHKVHGLTTAATVWVSAAAGIVCGLGAWRVAATGTVLVGMILIAGGPIERWLIDRDNADLESGSPSSQATEPPDQAK